MHVCLVCLKLDVSSFTEIQYLEIEWSDKGTLTIESMMLNICANLSDEQFFFCQGFLSQTLAIHRVAGEGRGPSFIPLYHFHPLTNIYASHLFASLHVRRPRVFNRNACVYQTAEIYHVMELPFDWLIDDAMFVCLLDELILGFRYSDLLW